MRAIGVTSESAARHRVPTMMESGFDVVIGNWRGVYMAARLTSTAQRARR